jgi:hypothetical protein
MVLIAGGEVDRGAAVTNSAEIYNPAAGTFTLVGSLNIARSNHTATLLSNGMVLIAGGEDCIPGSCTTFANAELYDPATGTFTLTGSLNDARYAHTATLLNNGVVLIAGGATSSSSEASAELYNPATGSFALTGNLSTARAGHTATLLNNGMVLMAGGGASSSAVLSSAELYNPAAGTFAPTTGSLNTARSAHTATLLNNSTVLIAGGVSSFGSGNFLASAELYDPATQAFTTTASLNAARATQTATLLNDGLVLIAGGLGIGNLSGPFASAELYEPATLRALSATTARNNLPR